MDPHRPNQPNSFVANLAALEIPNGLPNIPALSVGIPSNQGLPGIQFVLPAIPSTIPDDMTDAAREEVYDTVVSMSLSMAQKAAIDARSVQSHVKLLRLMNNFSRMENAAAVAANNDVVPSALMCSSTSSAQLQLEAPKQEAIVPATRPLGQKVEDTAHAPVLPKPIDDSRDSGSSGVANNAGIISNTTNDAPNRGLPDDSSELSAAITTASIPPKPLEDVTIVPTDSCNMESVQSADALEKKDEIKSVKSESVDVNGSSNVTDHCEVSMEQDEVVDAPIDLNESKTLPVELTESALVSSPKKDRTVLSSTPIEDEAVKTIDISDKNDSVKMQDTISSDKSNVFNHDETLPMEQSHDDDVPIKLDSIETPSDETQDGSVEIEKNSGSVETENIVSRDPLKDTDTSPTENTEEFPKEKSQDYEASNTVKSDSISMEVLENETVKASEPMKKLSSGQTEAIISSDASDDSDDKHEKESKEDDDSSKSNSTEILSQKNADDVSNFSQKPIEYEDVDAEETVQDVDTPHWENTEKLPEEQAPDDDASNPVESINDGVTSFPSELHEDETVEAAQPLEEVETNETKNHVYTGSSDDTDHHNLLEEQSPDDDESNFMRSDNVDVAVPSSHTSNHDETPLLSDLVEEIDAAIYTEKRDEPPNQTVEEDLAMSDDEFDDDSTKLFSINIPQEGDTSNTDRVLLTSSQIKKEIVEDMEIKKNPGNVEPELIDLCDTSDESDDEDEEETKNIPQEEDSPNTSRALLNSSQIKKEIVEDMEIEKNPGNVEPELIDLCDTSDESDDEDEEKNKNIPQEDEEENKDIPQDDDTSDSDEAFLASFLVKNEMNTSHALLNSSQIKKEVVEAMEIEKNPGNVEPELIDLSYTSDDSDDEDDDLHEDETDEDNQPLEEVETIGTKNPVFTGSSNDTDHENLLERQSPDDDDSNSAKSHNDNVAVQPSQTSNQDETSLSSDLVDQKVDTANKTVTRVEPPNQTVEEDLWMSDNDSIEDDWAGTTFDNVRHQKVVFNPNIPYYMNNYSSPNLGMDHLDGMEELDAFEKSVEEAAARAKEEKRVEEAAARAQQEKSVVGSASKLKSPNPDKGQSAQVSPIRADAVHFVEKNADMDENPVTNTQPEEDVTHEHLESTESTSEQSSSSERTRSPRAHNNSKGGPEDSGVTSSKRTRPRRVPVDSDTDEDEYKTGPVKRTRSPRVLDNGTEPGPSTRTCRIRVKEEPLDSE